jgi:hypothetical protein
MVWPWEDMAMDDSADTDKRLIAATLASGLLANGRDARSVCYSVEHFWR